MGALESKIGVLLFGSSQRSGIVLPGSRNKAGGSDARGSSLEKHSPELIAKAAVGDPAIP